MVDHCDCRYWLVGAMPYPHALSTLLFLPGCVCEESGNVYLPFLLSQVFISIFFRCGFANLKCLQYWRLFTTFIYFGPLSLNLLFHIFFIQRYARMLEESAVSQAHFTWMLAYAVTTLLCLAPVVSVVFLGSILSSTLVYIWSRKHPDVQLSFLGLFVFRAPFLPWVMIGLSVVMHGNWPKDELCGIAVGHGENTSPLLLRF